MTKKLDTLSVRIGILPAVMRSFSLLLATSLLLVSSIWASRIFLDDLEVMPGQWTQLGQRVLGSSGETLQTSISGDGRTLVRAITENYGLNGVGSISIFQREGFNWKQVGEPIVGAIDQPISYFGDISYDGNRIAYRTLNNFSNEVISDGELVSEWNAKWTATDPEASGGVCEDGGSACPGLAWQTVISEDREEDVLELSITGNDAYSLRIDSTSPPDLALSRYWNIQMRLAVPPSGSDVDGSTAVSVRINCPSGCEQISTNVSLPHNGEWQSNGFALHTMTDTEAQSIHQPLALDLPEGLAGAVIEISQINFRGAGDMIQIVESAEQPRKLWSYASRDYRPIFGRFSGDGQKVVVSGYTEGWIVGGSTPSICGGASLAGVHEVFELRSESTVRKGEPICGEFFGLDVYSAIDATAETLAVGRLDLGIGYPAVKVLSFSDGTWEEVFSVAAGSIGSATLPVLSGDGSVLVIGDQNYSYGGSAAGYSDTTGTYLDAAFGAGRIRRYEKTDGEWQEVGVPLIGNAGDYLALGYPRGISADGSRIVVNTQRTPVAASRNQRVMNDAAYIVNEREVVLFGQRVVLPYDAPDMKIPASSQRQSLDASRSTDTLEQSVKVLLWRDDGWHQQGNSISIEHTSAAVYVLSAISDDGQLISGSQFASCINPSLSNCLAPPEAYVPFTWTHSFTTLTDKIVLEDLYITLDGPNWTEHTGWLRDESHCAWQGVLCDGDGFVTALWLDDNNLSGQIPDTLGNLRYLRSIDLSSNALSGGLPPTLTKLADLSRLFASEAGLSGVLESSFGEMERLTYLDLRGNRLSADMATFAGLGNLRYLDLSGNAFSGNFPDNGPWPLAEHVNLSSNALSGTLPSNINALGKLLHLDLGNNAFSGRLPASVGNLMALEKIDLSENTFTGPIGESLGTFLAARKPVLTGNKFNCPYPSALVEYFAEAGEECVPPAPPGQPVILKTDYGDGEIVLVVAVAADGGAAINTYDAFCSDGAQIFIGSSDTTRIVLTGLTNGVTYTCHVTASNSAGSSEASSDTGAITPEELKSGLPIWLLYEAMRSKITPASTPIARQQVLRNGKVNSRFDAGIFAFDQALNYGACSGGPAPDTDCESIDFKVVGDADKGSVLEISYLSDQFAGIVIDSNSPGLDLSTYRAGVLKFDIKVVSSGTNTAYKVKLDDHNGGSTGEFDVIADNSGAWSTYSINMSDLLVNVDANGVGANLSLNKVKSVVFMATFGTTQDVVFRLDNVLWEQQ